MTAMGRADFAWTGVGWRRTLAPMAFLGFPITAITDLRHPEEHLLTRVPSPCIKIL
jgi:hypothetical protein